MEFTNNRLDLFDGESYGEIQHANAFAKGLPNFVVQGLELTGTTLNNGIFVNNGTFGQLGTASETHEITTNYTGFIVIESTLSGRTSTSRIIESPTFLSTDPRTASSVRHFTIYELSNGSIVNDFRHIDYVKSFEVRNIGGSQFVFILNGFVSAPFDASVIAGNRTLINDRDINYDDTIHATTPLQDILKDLFEKSQNSVGDDKPFELTFYASNSPQAIYNKNLGIKLADLIDEKYGIDLGIAFGTFRIQSTTADSTTNKNYEGANKVSWWNNYFYFEFDFDYDDWANVIVRDAKGNTSLQSERGEELLTSQFIGMYLHLGENHNVTIPQNCHITKIEFVFSDYDSNVNEILATQLTTFTISEGMMYSTNGGYREWDKLTSGQFDAIYYLNSFDATLDNADLANGQVLKGWNTTVDYQNNTILVTGGTFEYPDGHPETDIVLNSVNVYGYIE